MSSHKPSTLKFSSKARQDFVGILRYTGERWGPDSLQAYRSKIDDALQAISHNPQLGQQRADMPPTHLAYLVGSHVIVYRTGVSGIGIVRILHQRMSPAGHI